MKIIIILEKLDYQKICPYFWAVIVHPYMILNQKTHPDQSIIQGIIDNNQVVIGDIYKKYSQEVKAMVQSRGGSVHDAKDLMQEVLKELRQIRGILGRIARETTAAHADGGDR